MKEVIPHLRPWILPEDRAAVNQALIGKAVSQWVHAASLAEALSRRSSFSSCRLYGSGTLALRAALCRLGIPRGSGVGIPSFTCDGVLAAVVAAGYKPQILDCDRVGRMDGASLLKAHESGLIGACVAVHQFGLVNRAAESVAGMVPVIEDCSHVPPARYITGSVAAIGSLEGTKLLGAGEGGYLLWDEGGGPLGRAEAGEFDMWDLGSRLSDVTAVLALRQLERLDANIRRREEIANQYLAVTPVGAWTDSSRAVWFRFILSLDSLGAVKDLIAAAEHRGVVLRRPIMPYPLHRRWPGFSSLCPDADSLWETAVSFPLYPDLTDEEAGRVTAVLRECLP